MQWKGITLVPKTLEDLKKQSIEDIDPKSFLGKLLLASFQFPIEIGKTLFKDQDPDRKDK